MKYVRGTILLFEWKRFNKSLNDDVGKKPRYLLLNDLQA
jgi:hypothetical protein